MQTYMNTIGYCQLLSGGERTEANVDKYRQLLSVTVILSVTISCYQVEESTEAMCAMEASPRSARESTARESRSRSAPSYSFAREDAARSPHSACVVTWSRSRRIIAAGAARLRAEVFVTISYDQLRSVHYGCVAAGAARLRAEHRS